MPFTVSHAAAVLPLAPLTRRGPLVASALVAGSMAPDVPFFADSVLPGAHRVGGHAHRPWAVASLDVAIAAGMVGAWDGLLRDPLTALLPARWAALAAARGGGGGSGGGVARRGAVADAAWFAGSAAIGAASHVFVDSFTHRGRAGTRWFPALSRPVRGLPGGPPLYDVLQYATSLAGLAALAAHGGRALRRAGTAGGTPVPAAGSDGVSVPDGTAFAPGPVERRLASAAIGAAAAVGAAHRVARALRAGRPAPARRIPPGSLLATVCFGGGAGAVLGAAGYAIAARTARSARLRGQGETGRGGRLPWRRGTRS